MPEWGVGVVVDVRRVVLREVGAHIVDLSGGLVEGCGGVGGLLVFLGWALRFAGRYILVIIVDVGEVCRDRQWDAEVCCWWRVGVCEGRLEG